MQYRIPVSKPSIGLKEQEYVLDALKREEVSSQGSYVKSFEEALAKRFGVKYAATCSSGFTALILALRALGIKAGDEVIVPDFTMVASAWAISAVGATPVFVDCGEDLNINAELIERAITPMTKAIMPVHIYGRMCDMNRITEIAYQYNLKIVEDACEAHGAYSEKGIAGAIGSVGCFSLYGNKIITAGEGGFILTNDELIYQQVQHLKAMAFTKDHTFIHKKFAYNFRMSNLQAALGVAQLDRLDEFLAKRAQIQEWYDARLGHLTINRPIGSVLWYYDIIFPSKEDKAAVTNTLTASGIEWRHVFQPMHAQPMYQGMRVVVSFFEEKSKAYGFTERGIYLPTFPEMTKGMVDEISDIVLNALNESKRTNSVSGGTA